MTAFVFLFEDGESLGDRVARCAKQAGSVGTMGFRVDQERYEAFLRVRKREAQLAMVRTSCAVAASTVTAWCGRKLPEPWRADGTWGIESWLDLTIPRKRAREWIGGHPSWCWAEDGIPEAGCIFYRDYARTLTNDGHVGVLTRKHDSGLWETFEGGQWLDPKKDKEIVDRFTAKELKRVNGTICRMSREPKDIRALDKMGRKLIGWWNPNKIDFGEMPPTYPETAA